VTGLNPQAEQMADESMVRTLDAQARAIWPQEIPLLRRYSLPEEPRILDAGCGTGEGASRLAELFPRALDLIRAQRRAVRRRLAGLGRRAEADDGLARDHHRLVGRLRCFQRRADRIRGGGDFATPWKPFEQPKTRTVHDLQVRLQALGYPMDKMDGKIGSNTRKQIGLYQKASGLRVDCWPSEAVLSHANAHAVR